MGVKETTTSLVKVYPNPASNTFTIEVPDQENRQFSLFDMCGKLVQSQLFNGTLNMHTDNLDNGIYYVSVKEQNGVYNQKLVISK